MATHGWYLGAWLGDKVFPAHKVMLSPVWTYWQKQYMHFPPFMGYMNNPDTNSIRFQTGSGSKQLSYYYCLL